MENSIEREEDLILGDDVEPITIIDIIESQLTVIESVRDIPTETYDKLHEDIVKTMSLAFRVIQKAQIKILKNL